jgi:hypothetical protein
MDEQNKAGGADQPGPAEGFRFKPAIPDENGQDAEGHTLKARPATPEEDEQDAEGHAVKWGSAAPEDDDPGPEGSVRAGW